MRWPRPTIRLRLTLVYGALFAASSAVLIATSYTFVANQGRDGPRFDQGSERVRQAFVDAGFDGPIPGPPAEGRPELPGEVAQALSELVDQARSDILNDLLVQSLVAFAITAVGSLALAWWVAGRALAPVDAITNAANRLSEDNLDERLGEQGPDDELRRLRASFNSMLDRLERGFEARRRFAADASHELRTPMAVLRARADNVIEASDNAEAVELAQAVSTEVVRAERLIEALLALARAEGATATVERFDLSDLVGDVVGALAPEVDAGGLRLDLELADGRMRGDESLLRLLVTNLVRNAIVHNEPGGWLSITVSAEDDRVMLAVENSGPHIEPSELTALFERFHRGRAATDRHGHGLGLALVHAVAGAHRADLVADPRADGGLIVKVSFPLDAERSQPASTTVHAC